jgi:anhydro-N-acetylmuramic acid kinase
MSDQRELYIGLMSGTSLDGIDAVLMDFTASAPELIAQHHQIFPVSLHKTLTDLIANNRAPSAKETSSVGRELAEAYINAVKHLLNVAFSQDPALSTRSILAIGNHGQTVFHSPPISVQLDDGQHIANQTGICVVNQFRQADLELGGQGAPLVPAFHRHVFAQEKKDLAVLNIGGIANLTLLIADGTTGGFDTGPGNTLMDVWIKKHQGKSCDTEGAWGRSGKVHRELLSIMQQDFWLNKAPPKSTGREHFNLIWLEQMLSKTDRQIQPEDVQATLCELTASSIASALHTQAPETTELIVCGGGVHNTLLDIASSNSHGIHPDWVEAAAFAWLAMANTRGIPGNIPEVTGASQSCMLGIAHKPI